MKPLIFTLIGICFAGQLFAQPAARRNQTTTQTNRSNTTQGQTANVDRASLQFPTTVNTPTDVTWQRDIYRQLDLLKDKNAALYYPVEPTAGRMNLFTYLFKLLLDGRIQAYEYRLDGKESFTAANRINVKDLLSRYSIYFEEENGRIKVDNSDIPSADVTMFYIKESAIYDQRTAAYQRKVVAICPVMRRVSDFGEGTSYPLFWLKYDDISTFMARAPIMSSNYNNATNMTVADYFTMNKYDGEIYMTNNMQGKTMASDSTRVSEQKKIEQELGDFEKGIWAVKETQKPEPDSTAVAEVTKKSNSRTKAPTTAAAPKTNSRRSSSTSSSTKTTKAKSSSSSSSAPRVSVRRERR